MINSHGYPEDGGIPSNPEPGLFIEYVRAHGPVQKRLYVRFRRAIANALAALAMTPPENDVTSGIASNSSKRPRNEDSSVTLHAHSNTDSTATPVVLAAVADGMGGQADGDEASAIAVQTLTETVVDTLLDDSQRAERLNAASIEHLLMSVISEAHEEVMANTDQGGTTLTCALIAGNTATVAHVGDSRAYLLDSVAGEIRQITRDHTFANRMVEAGLLTEREAANHSQSHVIYHAIGVEGLCEPDIVRCIVPPGSGLLLCSDGIWRPLGADNIYSIVRQSDSPQEACDQLIAAAMDHSGYDDATAVLVRMPNYDSSAAHKAHAAAIVESLLELSLAAPVEQ